VKKSPVNGTPDQYEVGDLSGKYGTLRGLYEFEDHLNDTNLELGAPHSLLGRSIVIHRRDRNTRLVSYLLTEFNGCVSLFEIHFA